MNGFKINHNNIATANIPIAVTIFIYLRCYKEREYAGTNRLQLAFSDLHLSL